MTQPPDQNLPTSQPPLIKYGQGRDEHESGPLETPQTLAQKLTKAAYANGALSLPEDALTNKRTWQPEQDKPLPLVSRSGFRAGVICSVIGGAIIAAIFLSAGLVPAAIIAAGAIGFVAGMLATGDWQ